MKLAKRLTALLLTLVLVLSFAACGKATTDQPAQDTANTDTPAGTQQETKDAPAEPIVLEWYYRGNGIQKDTELVETEFNKLLQTYPGMENVTVHLNCYTGADYANAVALAQSAGTQIDILNTVYLDFVEQVRLGTYAPLNDLLADNQTLYNELPEWLWDLGSVDGNIYMVPHYQRAANQEYIVIPTEYMEKYGDEEAMRAVFSNPDRTVEEVAAVLEDFVTKVQAGEGKTKYAIPFGLLYTQMHGFTRRYDSFSGDFVLFEGDDKVEYRYDYPDAVKAYEIAAEWYDKGIIDPEVLTNDYNEMVYANMMNPVSYCFSLQNGAGSEELVSANLSKQYGFDVMAIPIWDNYFIANSWGAGGDGITAKCAHPTEALRLIELMNTEEGIPLYNMVVYGLEGTHYEKLDDTHIKTFEYDGTQGGVDTSYAAMKWIMGNTFHAYLNQGCVDGENEIAMEINNSDKNAKSAIMGFRADTSKVQTQIEQINAVKTEYYDTVSKGVLGAANWKTAYDEFTQKLEAAGINDVLTELQSQIDAFLASK